MSELINRALRAVTRLYMKKLILFIAIITLSCKSHKNSKGTNSEKVSVSEELNLILSDNYGGSEFREIQVIRSGSELKRFFIALNKTRKPGLPVPKIDFNKELVVVFCGGITTHGDIPGLYMVSESDDKLILGLNKTNGVTDSSSTAVLMPFGLYTMPLTDKEIVLDRQE